jgi:hypothetical protein
MEDHRKNSQNSKIIYELIISQIRSEEIRLFSLYEKLGEEKSNTKSNPNGMRDEINCREKCLRRLQHSLDWYVEKLFEDRRK